MRSVYTRNLLFTNRRQFSDNRSLQIFKRSLLFLKRSLLFLKRSLLFQVQKVQKVQNVF